MRYELFPQKFTKKHFNLEKITNLLVKFHFDRYFEVFDDVNGDLGDNDGERRDLLNMYFATGISLRYAAVSCL